MADHTFVSARIHYIFSTKDRLQLIKAEFQPRLWSYLAGIARNLGTVVYGVGGSDNHAHVFVGIPATTAIAEIAQKLKANSSRFMHEMGHDGFAWQEGYAAFSVSSSQTDATMDYIRNQAAHHAKLGYGDEMANILARYGMTP